MAGIYIHVPFCKTRCIYCDFYTGTDKTLQTRYLEALCQEIQLRKTYIDSEPIKTIYFGGGTPSQLAKLDFEKIFNKIYQNFEVFSDAEITLEANPDDLNDEYLKNLRLLPFNRISIGIQSFDDRELRFLKRRHNAQKAINAVKKAQDLGFNNISIDLIYGLPGQTLKIWDYNLETAITLGIQHISSYHLIYEEGTVLNNLLQTNKLEQIDEEISLEMFSLLINKLEKAGFEHYEISNFAKDGLYSKHNTSYWQGEKYLGLGTAAHSYNGANRAWNIPSISKYIKDIESHVVNSEYEILDEKARYNDFILTGLRTKWGVNLDDMKKLFGDKMLDYCLQYAKKYYEQGFLQNTGNTLRLTTKGIFISDSIMSDMMYI